MQGDDDVLKDANINDFEDEPDVTADVLIDYADDAMVPCPAPTSSSSLLPRD